MPKPKRQPTRVVYLKWFDSSITQGGTCTAEDAAGVLTNESVGILVAEDKKCVTIALDRCVETQGFRCTLCVPKINVLSLKRFKV